MWRKIDVLVPPFLKKLDHQLLINYPAIWATRIHYLLFVAGLLGFMFMVLMGIQPIKLYDIPDLYGHVGLMLIPLGMVLIVWLTQARKFQLSQQYGDQTFGQKLKVQYTFVVGILSLALALVLTIPVKVWKVQNTISKEELVKDYNIFMIGLNSPIGVEYLKGGKLIYGEKLEGMLEFTTTKFKWREITSNNDSYEFYVDFVKVLQKYTGNKSSYSPKQLATSPKEKLMRDKNIKGNLPSESHSYQWEKFLQMQEDTRWRLQEVKTYHNHPLSFRQLMDEIHLLFFSIFTIWLFSMLYLKQGSKNFFLQFIGLTIIGSLAVPFFMIFEDNFRSDELFLSCWYLSFMIACLIQAFRSRNSTRMIRMKRIALGTAVLATPLLPAVLHEMLTYHEPNPVGMMIYMLYFGAFLTFVLWNLIYSKRFEALTASPREN